MRTSLLLTLLFLVPGTAGAAFSASDAGTAAAQFLRLGADARSEGMGEAVRAVTEDANAVYWNPAGLAGLDSRSTTFTHGVYYQSVFYDYLAYAQPVDTVRSDEGERFLQPSQLGSVGAAVLYLNAGSINEVDNTGTPTGQSFTPQDFAALVAWGAPITRNLDVGIGAKFISSKIEETAETGAADFAARLHLDFAEMPYTLAAGIQNLGGQLKFLSQANQLPLLGFVANALRPARNWVLSAEVVAPRDGKPYLAAGTEVLIPFAGDIGAALRAGYNGRTSGSALSGLTGLSAGGGLSFAHFTVDYAWAPYGVLGDTQRFSLSCRF